MQAKYGSGGTQAYRHVSFPIPLQAEASAHEQSINFCSLSCQETWFWGKVSSGAIFDLRSTNRRRALNQELTELVDPLGERYSLADVHSEFQMEAMA
jgi:hypothetical protein